MTPHARLRICHVVSDDAWGGAEAVVANLLQAQSARPDHEVHLVVLNEGGVLRVARECGVRASLLPESGRSFLRLARDFGALLESIRPDVVHTHRYKENLLAYLVAHRRGARSVVTLHGYEPPAQALALLKGKLRLGLSHLVGRLAGARYIAVSTDLRDRLGFSADRCVVIPNGVVVPEGATVRTPRTAGVLTIGWVGRMVPIKGLDLLLEAVACLPPPLNGVRVLLVGDGPERAAVERRAAELGLADRVELTGFLADTRSQWPRMDVFALPSLHEGAPLALLEALAAGVPVVASAVGGIPEIVGDSGCALLVAPRTATAWAEALTVLLESADERRALSARGLRHVRERFSLDAMVDRYAAVYEEALTTSGR